MSDLISRKALSKAMEEKYKIAEATGLYPTGLSEAFIIIDKIVREQPAAYDMDKVVEQLEETKRNVIQIITLNTHEDDINKEIEYAVRPYDNCIKMVKGGRLDE